MKFLLFIAIFCSFENLYESQYNNARELKNEIEKFEVRQEAKWKQIQALINCRFYQIQNLFEPNKQSNNETNKTFVLDPCAAMIEINNTLNVNGSKSESKSPPNMLTNTQSSVTEHYYSVNEYATEYQRKYTLQCNANGYPKPTYRWKKDGITLDLTEYGNRITTYNTSGSIEFKQLLDSDEGSYQCFADNQYGTAVSNTVKLLPVIIGSFPDNETFKVVNANLGQPLTLHCDMPFGSPKPKAIWSAFLANGVFTKIERNSRLIVDPDGRLHFSSVMRTDMFSPNYYCAAKYHNNYRDGRHFKINVDLSESVAENTTSYPITLQYVSPANITALRGSKLDLYCIFGGTPVPKVSWYKKSGIGWLTFPSTYRYGYGGQTVNNNYDKVLTFNNLQYENSGTYSCYAVNNNTADGHTHVIELTVESAPFWQNTSPHFRQYTDDYKNSTEGQSVTLKCDASAKPEPVIQWYMNGIPIEEVDDNSRRIIDGNVLSIENVSETLDTGVYQCNASNIHGYAFKNIYLNVFQ